MEKMEKEENDKNERKSRNYKRPIFAGVMICVLMYLGTLVINIPSIEIWFGIFMIVAVLIVMFIYDQGCSRGQTEAKYDSEHSVITCKVDNVIYSPELRYTLLRLVLGTEEDPEYETLMLKGDLSEVFQDLKAEYTISYNKNTLEVIDDITFSKEGIVFKAKKKKSVGVKSISSGKSSFSN